MSPSPASLLPITAVIPTYNRADRVFDAIESVLAQSRPAAELIVMDDGSTDDTIERLKDLIASQADHSRTEIRYFCQANAGVSAARNRAVEASRQPWIAFLDSDDRWLPTKLEMQWKKIEDDSDAVLVHTEEIWIRRGVRVNPKQKHQKRGGQIFLDCLPLCCISPSSALIRRSVFEEVGAFDEVLRAGEDYDLWLRICSKYPTHFVEEPQLIKFGGHEDQLSHAYWGMDRFRVYALEKLLFSASELPQHFREAAHAMLLQKLEILHTGARKRDNWEFATRCAKRLSFWRSQSWPLSEFAKPSQTLIMDS